MSAKPVEKKPISSKLTVPQIQRQRSESFRSVYANNSFLELSAWDVKINFGEIEQSIDPNTIINHTAITMPWAQAKILAYFLQVHVAAHEIDHGHLVIPVGVIPGVPAPDQETLKQWPNATRVYQAWTKLHDEFIVANPEAAPAKTT
jgi:hypothetical protein